MKETIELSWINVLKKLDEFEDTHHCRFVYGVPNGGMILTSFLKELNITPYPEHADIILDDIESSGKTREYYKKNYPRVKFVALYNAKDWEGKWIVFPWEKEHPSGTKIIQDNVTRLIQYIGEDFTRDGLKDTPQRVLKSYQELFSGYGKDPKSMMTTFTNDGYQSMVVLRDIEIYSVCEHHMLPFYGKAHVAYIPDNGKIVGISKLARLVDIFARRLQVQERIGEQVTDALMDVLKPKGAACVIEAVHMCMLMRGVGKQNSVMVTSSVKGEFMTDPAVRGEFMDLIQKGK